MSNAIQTSHVEKAYIGLETAYDYFNAELFNDRLPKCLITLQRKKNSRGYFSPNRFSANEIATDEIALNPKEFGRTKEEILSTLVHEMAHLWQQHHGKPSKSHHNKQWGLKMKEIGLHPSDTGQIGGKETGQKMTHYIMPNGMFELTCARFLAEYELVFYTDVGQDNATAKKKAASKTKYTCPECDMNAWAKPDVLIQCVECDCRLIAEVNNAD